ncbi:MAG: hypothetical protein RLZZ383_609 [Pseudomonadota bacterium]|jgi:Xaa-Pro aminopeptidase
MTTTLDHAAHRQAVLDRLGDDEAMLLFANPTRTRSHDTDFRYRPSSDVWWLTGFPEPACAVFLRPGREPYTLFVQARNPEMETWTGRRHGPEGARARFGADAAWSIDDLGDALVRLLQGVRTLHYEAGQDAANDTLVTGAIARVGKAARRNGLPTPSAFVSPARTLHEVRLRKSDAEIAVLRRAAAMSAEAHVACMRLGAPGVSEALLDATLEHAFRATGGTGAGYNNIVAAGDNATILHYVDNNDRIEAGELVLVDAGGEVDFYTADITRTWPASGRFSEVQARAYAHVLAAQEAAIADVRVGRRFSDVHDAAVRRLVEGMVDLGLVAGPTEKALRGTAWKRYYMHGTSHWLGLDVHDVGAYLDDDGRSRALVPGMVLTVEPGLYVAVDDDKAPEALRGLGIRIEDDVLVTDGDPDVLTAACPKSIADLEAACARA